jgi:hypothetical protein
MFGPESTSCTLLPALAVKVFVIFLLTSGISAGMGKATLDVNVIGCSEGSWGSLAKAV